MKVKRLTRGMVDRARLSGEISAALCRERTALGDYLEQHLGLHDEAFRFVAEAWLSGYEDELARRRSRQGAKGVSGRYVPR